MKDFYGEELEVGDRVFLGGGCRRASQEVREGQIEKITSSYITVRVYRTSSGPVTRSKYYHAVTGKWIDPWFHKAQDSGYYHKETGEKLGWDRTNPTRSVRNPTGWGYTQEPNPDFVPERLREYRETVYKDYVKEVKLDGGGVSIITNSKGLVKITRAK